MEYRAVYINAQHLTNLSVPIVLYCRDTPLALTHPRLTQGCFRSKWDRVREVLVPTARAILLHQVRTNTNRFVRCLFHSSREPRYYTRLDMQVKPVEISCKDDYRKPPNGSFLVASRTKGNMIWFGHIYASLYTSDQLNQVCPIR